MSKIDEGFVKMGEGFIKIGEGAIKIGEGFIKKGQAAFKNFNQGHRSVQTKEQQRVNTHFPLAEQISDQELIRKALYYLLLPVSEAANYENFEVFMDHMMVKKQEDGKTLVYDCVMNKYGRVLEKLTESLRQKKSAVSLSIVKQIEDSIKEDETDLLK